MQGVGWALVVGGLILIASGTAILILGGTQLWRQMFKPPGGAAHTLAAGVFPVNLADLTKLIEAIIKMPQWLLAILAGGVQIYLGYWLAKGTRWF
jgi:hypothetical protein